MTQPGGTSPSFGAPIPLTGTIVGGEDPTGNFQPFQVDASKNLLVAGTLAVTPTAASTSVLSNVAASATSVTLLASNAARLTFVLYNDSTSALYVKLGATASATSFTKRMLPNEQWDTSDLGVNYTGRIDGIWDSAAGAMRVTELSA